MMECFVCDSFLRFVFQDSSKTSRKVSDKWVQTRGYQACVVYMPIPLRVCLAGATQEVRGISALRGRYIVQKWNREKTPMSIC